MMQQTENNIPEPQTEEKHVIGPRGKELPLKGLILKHLVLGIEKFDRPSKHYRLIWTLGDWAWLCKEDETPYRGKFSEGGIVEAGKKLAEQYGVKFSEVTR